MLSYQMAAAGLLGYPAYPGQSATSSIMGHQQAAAIQAATLQQQLAMSQVSGLVVVLLLGTYHGEGVRLARMLGPLAYGSRCQNVGHERQWWAAVVVALPLGCPGRRVTPYPPCHLIFEWVAGVGISEV